MKKLLRKTLFASLLAMPFSAVAQDFLIRNATVHTASARGSLNNTDVLVRDGRIAAIGNGLTAGAAHTIDAGGKPLTPALFGGITHIGLEEVSGEDATLDATLALGESSKQMVVRPEFDVSLAYNPESILIPIARVEGVGFTAISAGVSAGGSIIGGQGGIVRLDGGADLTGPKALYISLGASASALTGTSRAGQWLLLDQLIEEARGRIAVDSPHALLTPPGRATLLAYLNRGGRIVVSVQRAADIRQLLRWSQRHNVNIAIAGGAEAWKLAPELAAAKVPVLVDALANLPADFDQLGASMQTAARLRAAGVNVSFTQSGDASHNARKNRQLAGNAVANGLSWQDGLAGLTRVPAEIFGVADRIGTIEVGKVADLVLWSGDPLDIANTAQQIWLGGKTMPMRSRQTDLRDRYLRNAPSAAAGELPRSYTPQR
jgi:hypothetical protein